jgi:hypothetical protein
LIVTEKAIRHPEPVAHACAVKFPFCHPELVEGSGRSPSPRPVAVSKLGIPLAQNNPIHPSPNPALLDENRLAPWDKATFAKNFIGIGHAKALSVHLANHRVTQDRRRKWTGFVVALTVTFTVCDAQQIGLSTPGFSFSPRNSAFVPGVSPEQKTPPQLGPVPSSNQPLASRGQLSGSPGSYDGSGGFRYGVLSLAGWLRAFGPQLNSGESTRGPPLMDPPISC